MRTKTKFLRQPECTGRHSTLAIFMTPLGTSTTAVAPISYRFVGTAGVSRSTNDCQIRSERPIAFDRHPAPGACLRVVVPEGLMLDAAVVPEGDRMRLP